MSPELLLPDAYGFSEARPTKESDCYALGMVVHEILSGSTPFGRENLTVIILKVFEGERPERPEGDAAKLFTDGIWGMVERCWKDQPKERASARDLLRCLEGVRTEGGAEDLSDAALGDLEYVFFFHLIKDSSSIITPLL